MRGIQVRLHTESWQLHEKTHPHCPVHICQNHAVEYDSCVEACVPYPSILQSATEKSTNVMEDILVLWLERYQKTSEFSQQNVMLREYEVRSGRSGVVSGVFSRRRRGSGIRCGVIGCACPRPVVFMCTGSSVYAVTAEY